ncbi:MAG: energy-coupled thiamine transporter ThiT [Clostridia bacterium]|nr:energy-coupled thiamine transporter ThiT [Clostridia bacterium]
MENANVSKTRRLVECAIFIAVATVLSIIKLAELPYGGSITVASMLPIVMIAYRHGLGWGLGSGVVFGAIQQLLGLKTLSYVTTWQSVLAVVVLDYIVAFTVVGFGGIFRRSENRGAALAAGSAFACLLRYICHVISGATVWAGLSIPTKAALLYSFAYNATYMIPETIVLVAAAYYLGSIFDLNAENPTRVVREKTGGAAFRLIAGLVLAGMVVFDTVMVFSNLQDGESGEFYIGGLVDVNWIAVGIVTGACVALSVALFIISKKQKAAGDAE